ncbi:MAG: hypothetical protein AB7R89_27925 [Dehalococcoidia bacterium]
MFTVGSGNTVSVTQSNTQSATIESQGGDSTIEQTAVNTLSFNFGVMLPVSDDTGSSDDGGSNGG